MLLGRQFWLVKFDPYDPDNDPDYFFTRGETTSWRVMRPPKEWLSGDGVFFWEMSPTLAVVGLGEFRWPLPEKDSRGRQIFEVKHVTARLRKPVPIATLRQLESMQSAAFLKAGPQGTIFRVDSNQAADMYRLVVESNHAFQGLWPRLLK